ALGEDVGEGVGSTLSPGEGPEELRDPDGGWGGPPRSAGSFREGDLAMAESKIAAKEDVTTGEFWTRETWLLDHPGCNLAKDNLSRFMKAVLACHVSISGTYLFGPEDPDKWKWNHTFTASITLPR